MSKKLTSSWRCCLVPLAAAAAACGGDWAEYEPDPLTLPVDTVQSITYPAGPYGTKVGEKIDNLKFDQALFDQDTLCKKSDALDLKENEGVQPLSFLEIYQGDVYCPSKKKQFLWIVSSAGW